MSATSAGHAYAVPHAMAHAAPHRRARVARDGLPREAPRSAGSHPGQRVQPLTAPPQPWLLWVRTWRSVPDPSLTTTTNMSEGSGTVLGEGRSEGRGGERLEKEDQGGNQKEGWRMEEEEGNEEERFKEERNKKRNQKQKQQQQHKAALGDERGFAKQQQQRGAGLRACACGGTSAGVDALCGGRMSERRGAGLRACACGVTDAGVDVLAEAA